MIIKLDELRKICRKGKKKRIQVALVAAFYINQGHFAMHLIHSKPKWKTALECVFASVPACSLYAKHVVS